METLEATSVGKPETLEEDPNEDNAETSSKQPVSSFAVGGAVSSENTAAVEKLSLTCNSLQTQVEQLHSSLSGVIRFMSAFNNPNQGDGRTRHSSSTSTTQDTTFSFHGVTGGPASLPPSMFASMAASATALFDANQTPVLAGQQENFASLPPNLWQRQQSQV